MCCTLFYTLALAPHPPPPLAILILSSFHFQAAAPSLPKVNTTERLKELRQKMQQEGVQAYTIPSVDQHMVLILLPGYVLTYYWYGYEALAEAFKTLDIIVNA